MPSPTWRVRGILPVGALSMVYSPQEQGKTFFALDIALSVATGTPFQSREVRQGPVVYVLGEGRGGLRQRIEAWKKEHGVTDIEAAFFLLDGVQFRNRTDAVALFDAINALNVKPAMIIVDTFARSAVGVDENNAKDVGEWIEGVRVFQQWFDDVDLLVVHHAQKGGNDGGAVRERGSSAFIGATDTVIRLKRADKKVTVTCEKQKDAEHFQPFTLVMKIVHLGLNEHGESASSCVFIEHDGESDRQASGPRVSAEHLKIMHALLECPLRMGARQALINVTELKERTFDRRREDLLEWGFVERVEQAEPGTFRLTQKGEELVIATALPIGGQGEAA